MKGHSTISHRSFVCKQPYPLNSDVIPRRRLLRWCLGVASFLTLERSLPCQARIPTDPFSFPKSPRSSTKDRSLASDANISQQVAEIRSLTQKAESAFADRDYLQVTLFIFVEGYCCRQALQLYDTIVKSYPDLAVTDYARLHYALLCYQLGDVRGSILELDDLEVELRGYPEVHAALAVVLYTDRPLQLNRAEEQWDLATIFDRRYEDIEWVKKTKTWPPKMLEALDRFLTLR